jgi:hypothetical protein
MSWDSALLDLRQLLSDGPTDKYRWRKQVYPAPNGLTTSFKTFEFRRITDFTNSVSPLGIYKNGVLLSNNEVVSDEVSTGDFVLTTPPVDGDMIETTYYVQWFNDNELQGFLVSASEWLLFSDQYVNIPDGLRPSAKKFATSEAYQKLAVKYSERQSETYRVEDSMDPKTIQAVSSFIEMAKAFREDAVKLRDEFYTRSGQSLQPLFANIPGRVRQTTPSE